jgi:DNA-binding NtrC family response regulator
MSPSLNSEVVSLEDVPYEDAVCEAKDREPVILVVDDEPLIADTLTAILSQAGFGAIAAYDGSKALELSVIHQPELLITDIAMPDMNGVELALALLEVRPVCKVIFFSGHATSASLVNAVDAGHRFRLLSKPLHPTEMLRCVSKTLGVAKQKQPSFALPEFFSACQSA